MIAQNGGGNANLHGLNDKQYEAANYFDGPLLVLAGAGTGKTKTITSKISVILENKLAKPWQVLAVTFTNKAAKEMKSRIEAILGGDIGDMSIGTFHSICIKMLRKHAEIVGLDRNFTVLDETDQQKLFKDILEARRMDAKTYTPKNLLSIISRCKNKLIKPSSFTHQDFIPEFVHAIDFPGIWQAYQEKMQAINAVDFDDIIIHAITILERTPQVLEYYQNRFRYIMIDEYQDINTMQYRWIKLLIGTNQNICCVGDDDQSIYAWRGAEVQNILNFKRDFPTANIIRLEQNYRSTNSVLKVAYAVIKNNSSRLDKELWTEQSSDEPVQITHYNDSKQEAADVVQKIDFLTNKKFEQKWEYKDNAILLRSSSQTRVFEECLVANSIPYKIIGGVKFYERKEIKDVIAYLRVVISDTDTLAYERLLTYPKRGLGDKAIAEIFNYSGTNAFTVFYALEKLSLSADSEPKTYEVHTDLFGFAVPAKTFKSNIECPISLRSVQKSAILKIVNSIKRWRKSFQDGVKLNELAKAILFDLDYEEALKKDFAEDFQARIDNINELLSSLTGFGDIVEFLEYTTLITDTTDEVSFNEVSIMTLHASKGLEFPVVFLPCWDEGMFPNQRSIDESGEAGLEEERRLAYVGITRARQKLFISHAKLRITYGSLQGSQTSRFIDEIVEHANEFVNVSDNSSDGFYKSSKTRSKSRDTQKETGFYDEFKLPPSYAQKKLENAMPVGAKVMHAKYGKGVIKSRESQFAVVEFDETGSQKTIRTDFLTLLS